MVNPKRPYLSIFQTLVVSLYYIYSALHIQCSVQNTLHPLNTLILLKFVMTHIREIHPSDLNVEYLLWPAAGSCYVCQLSGCATGYRCRMTDQVHQFGEARSTDGKSLLPSTDPPDFQDPPTESNFPHWQHRPMMLSRVDLPRKYPASDAPSQIWRRASDAAAWTHHPQAQAQ